MATALFRTLTIEQLMVENAAFPKWVVEVSTSGPRDRMRILHEGAQFRKFLTETEEKRMDTYIFKGDEIPEWVRKCHELQTLVFGAEFVMCIHCGGPQLRDTQCLNSDDYHF